MHDTAEAVRAFEVARAIFPRVSFDLIYARQGQTLAAWRAELDRALALAIDHLSLYQLTIEPGTRFGDLAARGRLRGLPDAGGGRRHVPRHGRTSARRAGLPGYETSNHARPGAESRHNLVYWRYGDYAGIGPGAHGRLTLAGRRWAVEALRSPEAWLEAVERAALGRGLPHGDLRPGTGHRDADDGPPPAPKASSSGASRRSAARRCRPKRLARAAGARPGRDRRRPPPHHERRPAAAWTRS